MGLLPRNALRMRSIFFIGHDWQDFVDEKRVKDRKRGNTSMLKVAQTRISENGCGTIVFSAQVGHARSPKQNMEYRNVARSCQAAWVGCAKILPR